MSNDKTYVLVINDDEDKARNIANRIEKMNSAGLLDKELGDGYLLTRHCKSDFYSVTDVMREISPNFNKVSTMKDERWFDINDRMGNIRTWILNEAMDRKTLPEKQALLNSVLRQACGVESFEHTLEVYKKAHKTVTGEDWEWDRGWNDPNLQPNNEEEDD